MKKYNLIIVLLLLFAGIQAQEQMRIHNSDKLIYQQEITNIDSLTFHLESSYIFPKIGKFALPIVSVDSITFTNNAASDIYITFTDNGVEIINPYAENGVEITQNANHVSVTSTYETADLIYHVLGTTSNGSVNINSAKSIVLVMSQANITNPTGAAISLNEKTKTVMYLSEGTVNTLTEGAASGDKGALCSNKSLTIAGTGCLNVNSYQKHGIYVDATLTIESGIINIPQTSSDGIHTNDYVQNGGVISIIAGSDGIDASKDVSLNGGDLTITAAADDVKGLKANSLTINNGVCSITVSGKQSKAIKTVENTVINGGSTTILASGTVVMEALNKGYNPSYCTGIKSDANVEMNGGSLAIQCPTSNAGGRGISVDGDVIINSGTINITTTGNGATYTNESGTKDSYTPHCIKSDNNIVLNKGTITCSSAGLGGKGITADGTITIGELNANNALLNLKVTTTGKMFVVSSSGRDGDYANPKAIKALGDLILNSGTLNLECKEDGGEGLESKSSMYIKGGKTTITTVDDCINAAKHIEISGGENSFAASGNDGVDSNGTLTISGGLTISKGAAAPEDGFDCDNNTFKVLGGTMVGVGGSTSNPTASASTQNSLKLTIAQNQNICIKNSSGTTILVFAIPTLSNSGGGPGGGGPGGGGPGGGGPGGGSSGKVTLLFSDPAFTNGSYTLYYGGTISGGSNLNGYYTGATYSGGSSSTFTVSSKLTTKSI